MRCSHCREVGHNRSRCPQLPAEEKSTERFCSFCASPDHNRASCFSAKRETETLRLFSRTYRERILDGIDRIGMGPGAIVEWPALSFSDASKEHWTSETVVITAMVTGFPFIDIRTKKNRNRWNQAQSPSPLYLADPLSLFPGRSDLDEPWEKVSAALRDANPSTCSRYDCCSRVRQNFPIRYVSGVPTVKDPEASFEDLPYQLFHYWQKPFSVELKILSPKNFRSSYYSEPLEKIGLSLPPIPEFTTDIISFLRHPMSVYIDIPAIYDAERKMTYSFVDLPGPKVAVSSFMEMRTAHPNPILNHLSVSRFDSESFNSRPTIVTRSPSPIREIYGDAMIDAFISRDEVAEEIFGSIRARTPNTEKAEERARKYWSRGRRRW
jgi:hypothetical protein